MGVRTLQYSGNDFYSLFCHNLLRASHDGEEWLRRLLHQRGNEGLWRRRRRWCRYSSEGLTEGPQRPPLPPPSPPPLDGGGAAGQCTSLARQETCFIALSIFTLSARIKRREGSDLSHDLRPRQIMVYVLMWIYIRIIRCFSLIFVTSSVLILLFVWCYMQE